MRIKGITPDHDEQYRRRNVEQTGIADRVVLGNQNKDIFFILHTLSLTSWPWGMTSGIRGKDHKGVPWMQGDSPGALSSREFQIFLLRSER